MLIGMVTSYGVLLPLYANGQLEGADDLTSALSTVFKSDVRFIGAGVMAVAAIWTLIKIMGPIVRGMSESLRASRGAQEAGARSTAPSRTSPASGSSFHLRGHGSDRRTAVVVHARHADRAQHGHPDRRLGPLHPARRPAGRGGVRYRQA